MKAKTKGRRTPLERLERAALAYGLARWAWDAENGSYRSAQRLNAAEERLFGLCRALYKQRQREEKR